MVPYGPELAANRLKATMVGIWPELRDVRITHSWRGFTGFTLEQMPHVGCHDGMYFAAGYFGSGIAMASYLGIKVAYQALGDPRGNSIFTDNTNHSVLPQWRTTLVFGRRRAVVSSNCGQAGRPGSAKERNFLKESGAMIANVSTLL